MLIAGSTVAYADDTPRIRVRRLESTSREPLLHLRPLAAEAEGGLLDGHATVLTIGPRTRLVAEGRWWQSGLAPGMFAPDLDTHGWRAAAELSHNLGPFSIAVQAAMTQERDSSHRELGLFVFRELRLSPTSVVRISVGVTYEHLQLSSGGSQSGAGIGIRIGGTFR